jgi:hypothetical protein
MIFAWFSTLPPALSIFLWHAIPLLVILIISRGRLWPLLLGPVIDHFIGGQSVVFVLIGITIYRNHQKDCRMVDDRHTTTILKLDGKPICHTEVGTFCRWQGDQDRDYSHDSGSAEYHRILGQEVAAALPGDHDGGAGTAQLGEIAICSHADFEPWVLPANNGTIEVWL